MNQSSLRWIESMIVFYLSMTLISAINWEDGEFNGQVKWSSNCDFYDEDGGGGGGGGYGDNEIIDDDRDLIRLIGEQQSNRQDCGWLCWADTQCHYYSHSQNVCRTMSLKKKVLTPGGVSQHQRERSATFIHHVTMPYLADSETICGYIPSRIIAFNISVL
jgi:hypothetical protein